MTSTRILRFVVAALTLPVIAKAQTVKVDQQNRTIEISAESSIQVVADRVTITIGYRNYGPTHDEAFANNSRIADRILSSWKRAGVVEKNIATSALTSRATIPEPDWKQLTPAERKQRQYEVFQSWTISESPGAAEKLLDLAVDAGANEVGMPEWALADSDSTESQAYASALLKAHAIADQMAKSFGGKVGALLYASNEQRATDLAGAGGGTGGGVVRLSAKSRPETKLLPQKIEKTGYVRAIFALE
jgi:uncharacterized protein YggE